MNHSYDLLITTPPPTKKLGKALHSNSKPNQATKLENTQRNHVASLTLIPIFLKSKHDCKNGTNE